ncbi:hypothetical protein A11A3_14602 [Alcanivorax hongdengensis A-11-3]|uniref:Uncharacterized protein n=1 Tax=Alcanivorax hongdengensis A-11-3 TaxID=1177179 RepID=L0W943_9GAMM|nr:hypothetical protein [Alcanivorax hongdengensis]EKF73258.1 hypothetical protein A11A3_14602 [Alcanivorax hongdengensis A-11-3]
MDIRESLQTLTALAQGVNPVTGESFPEDSHYHHPQIIRALFVAIQALEGRKEPRPRLTEEQKREANRQKGLPANAGFPWEEEQRQAVGEAYRSGADLADLAKQFERTHGAIRSELKKQGLIEE